MYLTIELATVALEILFFSIYLKGLFQNYNRKSLFIIGAYLITAVGLAILSVLPVNPFLRLGYSFITIFLLAKVLFDAKWLLALYSALVMCAIAIIVDNIISGVISLFGVPSFSLFEYGNNRILFIVLAKLIQIFFIYLVIKLSNWKKSRDILFSAVPLLLCQVFSIFVCYIMYLSALRSEAEVTWSFVIGAMGILYINIVIFLYVERIKKISEIEKENELAEQLYNSKLEYFNQVKDDQEETRALWHDIKKYMNTINELIKVNALADAKDCTDHVSEMFSNTGTVVDIGNTVISAVLNHSVQKARRNNIHIELDVRVKQEVNISAADLSVIIGNTFDNAIEACEKLNDEDKKISIKLIQHNDVLFYEITNKLGQAVSSNKKDKRVNGYGLKNVRRCIEKYKGNMTIEPIGDLFKVSALLTPLKGLHANA